MIPSVQPVAQFIYLLGYAGYLTMAFTK